MATKEEEELKKEITDLRKKVISLSKEIEQTKKIAYRALGDANTAIYKK